MATLSVALFCGWERTQEKEERLEFFVGHLTELLPRHVLVIELMAARCHASAQSVDEHFHCPALQLAAGSQVQGWRKLRGREGDGSAGKS